MKIQAADVVGYEVDLTHSNEGKITISIYTNIEEIMGEGTFYAALSNYLPRVDMDGILPTSQGFCDYILSKEICDVVAITADELEAFIQRQGN